MLYLKSALFGAPIALFGVGTILAVQQALGFPDAVRHMLNFLLLVLMLVANELYGPGSVDREQRR